jgi:RNA polymerase sigma factor (sigma-70 family)
MKSKKTQKEIDEENGKIHAAVIVEMLDGDEAKEGELFVLTETKLYRVAFNKTKDRQTAKALAAKSWEIGMKDMKDGKYKEQNGFEKWMSAIIRNVFNKDKRDTPIFVEIKEVIDLEEMDIDAAALKEKLLVFIEVQLPKLTIKKQTLIHMFFWDGDTYKEIAATLDVSEAFVRSEIYKICRFIEAEYNKAS